MLFFQIDVITWFVKNECRNIETMKFEFKFLISDLENLRNCSNSKKDERKNDPDRSGSFLLSIAFSIRSKTAH